MTSQPQKFSKDATTEELLSMAILLYSISVNENLVQLNKFVTVTSRIIGPDDFNKLIRQVVKLMGDRRCGQQQCSDWLMTKLFDLYKVLGS